MLLLSKPRQPIVTTIIVRPPFETLLFNSYLQNWTHKNYIVSSGEYKGRQGTNENMKLSWRSHRMGVATGRGYMNHDGVQHFRSESKLIVRSICVSLRVVKWNEFFEESSKTNQFLVDQYEHVWVCVSMCVCEHVVFFLTINAIRVVTSLFTIRHRQNVPSGLWIVCLSPVISSFFFPFFSLINMCARK